MGDHYAMVYQGQPDDSTPDELYVVPENFALIVKDMEVISTEAVSGSSDTITVWLVPDGGSPDDTTVWLPSARVDGGERIEWNGAKCLDAGYSIVAQSGSGGILSMQVSGLVVDETPA